ncbi:hypothetical protein IFM89_016350 [Coptis chinensis]|uniref:Rad21/Rec8-like protein C-terminal eukaryotic domain-containing protein n=1 Tax=Coptis chinensis TaxID=261450 RepID=A0A835HD99_9MAGN|nr:hypothetical protein IFM89_016350 [Coptis chinensis]
MSFDMPGFLNFDDEDTIEEDNGIPNAEEVGILDNSGWSSHTRGVAKYLQTLFDTESGHGGKVLSMDNLLSGKTRKEASRMFFETLVLRQDHFYLKSSNPKGNFLMHCPKSVRTQCCQWFRVQKNLHKLEMPPKYIWMSNH